MSVPSKKLDRIDKNILVELQKDARIANVELAKRVGLSATPCLERVKRLEREGYIKCYSAVLDYDKLGLGMLVYIEIKLQLSAADTFNKFAQAAALSDDILECNFVSGEFDFLIKARVESMAAYREMFDKTIMTLPLVKETRTIVVMEEIKNERDHVIYP